MKCSIPKLSSFRMKDGITRKNIAQLYDDKSVEDLYNTVFEAVDIAGANMTRATIKGTLLCVIEDL